MSLERLYKKYHAKEPLACLTAYDASFAASISKAGADMILVGDSLGMVCQGQRDTIAVSMDDMVYHTRCVRRGSDDILLMSDLPFLACTNVDKALTNAGRLLTQAGADVVKLEGGEHNAHIAQRLVQEFIPVCGHIGLRPQQVRQLGGFFKQGKSQAQRQQILADAEALVTAGCCMLLLECMDVELAKTISQQHKVPTIGIGSGKHCSGQILVSYDVIGLGKLQPWFSKNFLRNENSIDAAFARYVAEVKASAFPT